jgi:hypothetical protein
LSYTKEASQSTTSATTETPKGPVWPLASSKKTDEITMTSSLRSSGITSFVMYNVEARKTDNQNKRFAIRDSLPNDAAETNLRMLSGRAPDQFDLRGGPR